MNVTTRFSAIGIVVVAVVLWTVAQSGSPQIKSIINRFLGVLLLSMVLLNFNKIRPIFFKDTVNAPQAKPSSTVVPGFDRRNVE